MIDDEEQTSYKPKPINFHRKLRELARQGRTIPDVVEYPGDEYRLVIKNQLIVKLDSPLSTDARYIDLAGTDVRGKDSEKSRRVTVKRVCHCNPSLVLLEGDEVHFLTGEIGVKYSPDTITPPPKINTSSANDIRYSPDTITPPPKINTSASGPDGNPVPITPVSFDSQLRRIIAGADDWKKFPVVAVMDTGIDFAYPNTGNIPILYNEGQNLCETIEPDYIGWDFVHDQNNPYDDDDNNKHGSRIAAIISREMRHKVRILPLKVIDSLGIGSLFDIFCGFEYVLSANLLEKPVVINASWGFYSQTENLLLTDYMRRLKAAKMWLVNAAGNRGDITADQIKNLDEQIRFPACYSKEHSNVVTITTISNKLSPRAMPVYEVVENYSPTFVNAGIGSGKDSTFREPLVDGIYPQVKGSSYATPYAAAYATQVYQPPVGMSDRDTLLTNMPGRIIVAALIPTIVNGLFVPVEND